MMQLVEQKHSTNGQMPTILDTALNKRGRFQLATNPNGHAGKRKTNYADHPRDASAGDKK